MRAAALLTALGLLLLGPAPSVHALPDVPVQQVNTLGIAPDPGQEAQLQAALQALETAGWSTAAAGLAGLLDAGRVVIAASGQQSVSCTTRRDGRAGASGDVVYLSASVISGHVDLLAGSLLHGWTLAKEEPLLEPVTSQRRAYQAEHDFLLGSAAPAAVLRRQRLAQVLGGLAQLAAAAQGGGGVLPIFGYVEVRFADHPSNLWSFQDSSELVCWRDGDLTPVVHDLHFLQTYDLIDTGTQGPEGGQVMVASGLDQTTGQGTLEYFEFDTVLGIVTQTLARVELPGIAPLSLVYEDFGGTPILHVLDPPGDALFMLADGDLDDLPDSPPPLPFATASNFPPLDTTRTIVKAAGQPMALHLSSEDLRITGGLPTPGSPFPLLTDGDLSGTADTLIPMTEAEVFGLSPGFLGWPGFGATDVPVVGTAGTTVELHASTSSGLLGPLLGSTVVGPDRRGTVTVPAPLEVGEWLRLVDSAGPPGPATRPHQVREDKEFGVSCPADATAQVPRVWMGPDARPGKPSRWHLDFGAPGTPVAIYLSFANVDFPADGFGAPGCVLYAWPPLFSTVLVTDAQGEAQLAVGIPNNPSLLGTDVYGQYHVADTANTLGLVLCRGMAMRIQAAVTLPDS